MFADDRSRLPRDRRFIDRCNPPDDVAVTRNYLASGNHHEVAQYQVGRGDVGSCRALGIRVDAGVVADDPMGDRRGAGLAQACGLGLTAAFRNGLGQVGEDHGDPEPDRDARGERGGDILCPYERAGNRQHRREGGTDLDNEHDGIAPHQPWVELAECAGQRSDELPE